jgi:hypothetical protein
LQAFLLVLFLAVGCTFASAQSSAGSLRDAPASNSGTTATPTSTKNSKVEEFNALQEQERLREEAIQKAGDDILNGLKGSGNSDLAPNTPDPSAPDMSEPEAEDSATDSSPTITETPTSTSAPSYSAPFNGVTPSPNSAAAVNSLLDDAAPGGAAPNSAAAVNSLLDDSREKTATPNSAAAINSLLEDPNAPKPGDPFYQPPVPDKSQWYAPPAPLQDSDMNADLQDSTDQPNPSMLNTLKQELQSGVQTVKDEISDGLNSLVTSGKSLIAPIMSDPGLQAIYHVVSNGGATMPLTTPTDSGDTMIRNVAGQAWLGSTDMIKNGPVVGRTKMIDQNSAYMGWAQANIPTISGGTQP